MKKHKLIWFTGLSGAGKTTLSLALYEKLKETQKVIYLDGDVVRNGLCDDLGFSKEDRKENLRRIREVAKLFLLEGYTVIAAFISPFREDRDLIRYHLDSVGSFIEVYVKTPIEECIKRDPKGLYKKALNGEIKQFTGIDSPYEPPESPEIIVDTLHHTPEECLQNIILDLNDMNGLSSSRPD